MLTTPYTQRSALLLHSAANYRHARAYHLGRAKTLDGWKQCEAVKSADRAYRVAMEQLEACHSVNRQSRHYARADNLLRAAEAAEFARQDIIAAGLRYKAHQVFSLAGV